MQPISQTTNTFGFARSSPTPRPSAPATRSGDAVAPQRWCDLEGQKNSGPSCWGGSPQAELRGLAISSGKGAEFDAAVKANPQITVAELHRLIGLDSAPAPAPEAPVPAQTRSDAQTPAKDTRKWSELDHTPACDDLDDFGTVGVISDASPSPFGVNEAGELRGIAIATGSGQKFDEAVKANPDITVAELRELIGLDR